MVRHLPQTTLNQLAYRVSARVPQTPFDSAVRRFNSGDDQHSAAEIVVESTGSLSIQTLGCHLINMIGHSTRLPLMSIRLYTLGWQS